jgi:hypothetical protein
MPSKKKKKAAKAAKKEGVDNKEAATVVAVDSQMQRLKIKSEQAEEDALLEEAIKLAAAETKELKAVETCKHGYSPRSGREHDRCGVFVATFIDEISPYPNTNLLLEAAIATEKRFPGVWRMPRSLI